MTVLVDFPVKPEARPYLDAFAESASEPDWLRNARRVSLNRFAELGFPGRKSESWRYLDLRALEQHPMLPIVMPQPMGVPTELALDTSAARIVLVDGRFAPELSRLASPDGVWLGSTRMAVAERPDLVKAFATDSGPEHPFASLNAALFADGFVLEVGYGVVVDAPIEIVHLASGAGDASLHTRNMIEMAAGSRATVVETYAGSGKYWRNDFALWRVEEDAVLTRIALVEEAGKATHFEDIDAVLLTERAKLNAFSLLLGGGAVRQEISVAMASVNAECRIDGAFVVSGQEEANIVTTIDHQLPGGTTSELVKGVAAGRGHGAFQGKITVRAGAQQTDAKQTSRNLILGRRASIDTKPELEILADDVKCAHGASIGDLDEAALFYLRARGIPTDEARRLLVEGFLREPVEGVVNPAIREHLLRRLSARLVRLEEWA
jgi:Fe-S cluster assembly protein SufD